MSNITNGLDKFVMNETIPFCPNTINNTSALYSLGYPTTTIISIIYSLTSLIFSIIIAFKYNSVKVFNRKIRTQNISNTMWIVYYLSVALRTATNSVLFGIHDKTSDQTLINGIFFDAGMILSAINAFTLCLSLNHQRRYRSSAPPNPPPGAGGSTNGKESEPLLGKSDLLRKTISFAEIIFFFLFALNLAFLYVAIVKHTPLFVLLYVAAYILQRIPIILLTLVIITHRNGNEGPTKQSKVYLFFASVFHLASSLPVFFWVQILPDGCVLMEVLSWIDILTIINFISLILFFLFLRSEYLRNMEECIWTTVSQIQDTFDFRRF